MGAGEFLHKSLIRAGSNDAVNNMMVGAGVGAVANIGLGVTNGDFSILGNGTSGALMGAVAGGAARHAGANYVDGLRAAQKEGEYASKFNTTMFTKANKMGEAERQDFWGGNDNFGKFNANANANGAEWSSKTGGKGFEHRSDASTNMMRDTPKTDKANTTGATNQQPTATETSSANTSTANAGTPVSGNATQEAGQATEKSGGSILGSAWNKAKDIFRGGVQDEKAAWNNRNFEPTNFALGKQILDDATKKSSRDIEREFSSNSALKSMSTPKLDAKRAQLEESKKTMDMINNNIAENNRYKNYLSDVENTNPSSTGMQTKTRGELGWDLNKPGTIEKAPNNVVANPLNKESHKDITLNQSKNRDLLNFNTNNMRNSSSNRRGPDQGRW